MDHPAPRYLTGLWCWLSQVKLSQWTQSQWREFTWYAKGS